MMWRKSALQHAVEAMPSESCGLVIVKRGRQVYWPCQNLAGADDGEFVIDPEDWAAAEDEGEVIAIVHSHPSGDLEPSQQDKQACLSSALPWWIVEPKTGQWHQMKPGVVSQTLLGREWVWGETDCWTLVRDWYAQQGIDLPDWERPETPEEFEDQPLFDSLWQEAGFRELAADEPLQVGDALLFGKAGVLDHVGVLVEPQMVLHHLKNKLSSRDLYGKALIELTGRRLRHASQD